MPLEKYQRTLAIAQGDGTTLTAAARASMIPAAAKRTLAADYFDVIGKALLIEAWGRITVAVTTPGTVRFDFGLGAVVAFDSLAILLDTAGYSNVGWYLRVMVTCRAVGATANLAGQAFFQSAILAGNPATPPKGSLGGLLPWNTAPAPGANFDSGVANVADAFYTPSLGTTSLTLHQYVLTALN